MDGLGGEGGGRGDGGEGGGGGTARKLMAPSRAGRGPWRYSWGVISQQMFVTYPVSGVTSLGTHVPPITGSAAATLAVKTNCFCVCWQHCSTASPQAEAAEGVRRVRYTERRGGGSARGHAARCNTLTGACSALRLTRDVESVCSCASPPASRGPALVPDVCLGCGTLVVGEWRAEVRRQWRGRRAGRRRGWEGRRGRGRRMMEREGRASR